MRLPEWTIYCPETDERVSTGMDVDDLAQAVPGDLNFSCASCGQIHSWDEADAILEDF